MAFFVTGGPPSVALCFSSSASRVSCCDGPVGLAAQTLHFLQLFKAPPQRNNYPAEGRIFHVMECSCAEISLKMNN